MAKTRAKGTKKAKQPPSSVMTMPRSASLLGKLNRAAAAIVREIVDEMNLTIASVGKSFVPGALDEWRGKLFNSVLLRLISGGSWAKDRPNVLAVAHDMALISAIISGSSSSIAKGRVHAAFRAVKDHATCPGGLGGGRWCDFDI